MRPARRESASRVALAALALGAALAIGCAAPTGSSGPGATGAEPRAGGSRVAACRAGDREVASEDACLLDDAACYELATGAWCTGPRGASCPAGSSALAAGAPCPPGARCIRASESLECVIG